MNKNKKIYYKNILLILPFILIMYICGCQRQGLKPNNADKLPEIVVGCDNYSPFSYADIDGNMVGIDVEIAREAFYRMGYSPKFVFINWADKKKLLKEGQIDCIWSSFTMTDREDEYNWAGPYMKSKQVIVVNEDSDIFTFEDLKGKIVAVQSTTKPEDIIRKHDGTLPDLKEVITTQKRDLLFLMLSKGSVDAIGVHDTSVDQFMKETQLKFRVLEKPLQAVDLGVAFDKEDKRGLDEKLTETLNMMRKDGTIERIIGKYLSDASKYLEEVTDEE